MDHYPTTALSLLDFFFNTEKLREKLSKCEMETQPPCCSDPKVGSPFGNDKSTYNRKQFSWDIFATGEDTFGRIPPLSVCF